MRIILSILVKMNSDQENKDLSCEKKYRSRTGMDSTATLSGLQSLISHFPIDYNFGQILQPFCSLTFLICKMGITRPTTETCCKG